MKQRIETAGLQDFYLDIASLPSAHRRLSFMLCFLAEAIQKEAVVTSEDPTGAQEEVPAPSPPSEDPVNVTITVTATP